MQKGNPQVREPAQSRFAPHRTFVIVSVLIAKNEDQFWAVATPLLEQFFSCSDKVHIVSVTTEDGRILISSPSRALEEENAPVLLMRPIWRSNH